MRTYSSANTAAAWGLKWAINSHNSWKVSTSEAVHYRLNLTICRTKSVWVWSSHCILYAFIIFTLRHSQRSICLQCLTCEYTLQQHFARLGRPGLRVPPTRTGKRRGLDLSLNLGISFRLETWNWPPADNLPSFTYTLYCFSSSCLTWILLSLSNFNNKSSLCCWHFKLACISTETDSGLTELFQQNSFFHHSTFPSSVYQSLQH